MEINFTLQVTWGKPFVRNKGFPPDPFPKKLVFYDQTHRH